MEQEKMQKILSRLQALCSRKECCESEIRTKALKLAEGDEQAASDIVKSLVEDRFVDDFRYASAFAREKASLSGWGSQKIVFMLARKGVDRKTALSALEEIDPEASAKKLESVITAKYKSLADDPQCKLKLLRFALSRGYGYDEVKSVVENVMRR